MNSLNAFLPSDVETVKTVEFNVMTMFDQAIESGLIKGAFAKSLSQQAQGRLNRLSLKQQEWVSKLLKDATGTKEETPVSNSVGNTADDFRFLLNKLVSAGGSKAFIRVAFDSPEGIPNIKNGTIRLSLASSGSSNAGCAYVKYTSNEGEEIYIGKIHPNRGAIECPASVSYDLAYHVRKTLHEITDADSLVKAAKKYAFATSSCSFCSIALTDKRSVAVGYGPICASNYGLPWG